MYRRLVMNANMKSFDKTLLRKMHFRWSIISMGVSVYSCQLTILQAHEQLLGKVMLGFYF